MRIANRPTVINRNVISYTGRRISLAAGSIGARIAEPGHRLRMQRGTLI